MPGGKREVVTFSRFSKLTSADGHFQMKYSGWQCKEGRGKFQPAEREQRGCRLRPGRFPALLRPAPPALPSADPTLPPGVPQISRQSVMTDWRRSSLTNQSPLTACGVQKRAWVCFSQPHQRYRMQSRRFRLLCRNQISRQPVGTDWHRLLLTNLTMTDQSPLTACALRNELGCCPCDRCSVHQKFWHLKCFDLKC